MNELDRTIGLSREGSVGLRGGKREIYREIGGWLPVRSSRGPVIFALQALSEDGVTKWFANGCTEDTCDVGQ